ncbi:MAG: transglycosylase SLT domain-containing protein [Pseudomonadota bacterium]|nr:transglycosylase SLT domain-containing protein [Pseudomonadota bacterium]
MLIQPAQAKTYSGMDDALVCKNAALKYEEKYQIKEHLLTTITNVETGRWNAEKKQTLGWPWTINAQGKGHFFKTKAEAVKAVKALQAKGVKSIDVGCMQINLKFHGKNFKSVEEALDPYKNVEYGAKYLKKLYKAKGNDWFKAAMAYHSNVLKKALRYKKKLVVAYAKVKKQNDGKSIAERNVKAAKVAQNIERGRKNEHNAATKKNVKKITTADIAEYKLRNNDAAQKAQSWREQKLAEYRQGTIN